METRYAAPFLLRAFAWELLKANTMLTEEDYAGLIPIVPVSDEPRLREFSKPYIVYGYNISTSTNTFENHGYMTMAIYANDFGDITKIINILTEAFGRDDESADDVNNFTSSIKQFIGIRFGNISVAFADGGTPEDEEGGRMSGIVSIKFSYFTNYSIKLPQPTLNPDTGEVTSVTWV